MCSFVVKVCVCVAQDEVLKRVCVSIFFIHTSSLRAILYYLLCITDFFCGKLVKIELFF